jgi:hypothetical protein
VCFSLFLTWWAGPHGNPSWLKPLSQLETGGGRPCSGFQLRDFAGSLKKWEYPSEWDRSAPQSQVLANCNSAGCRMEVSWVMRRLKRKTRLCWGERQCRVFLLWRGLRGCLGEENMPRASIRSIASFLGTVYRPNPAHCQSGINGASIHANCSCDVRRISQHYRVLPCLRNEVWPIRTAANRNNAGISSKVSQPDQRERMLVSMAARSLSMNGFLRIARSS